MPEQLQSIAYSALPALGQELDGGIFRGITTKKDGTHCAVIRLPNKAQEVNWTDGKAWAADHGGELPSKAVAALLTSNEELDDDAFWTGEEYNASLAWYFNSYGFTSVSHKSAELSALAVRLIPITA